MMKKDEEFCESKDILHFGLKEAGEEILGYAESGGVRRPSCV